VFMKQGESQKKRQLGMITEKYGVFYFQNRKGDLFDIVQNEQIKDLYANNKVIICQLLPNLKENSYFAVFDSVVESNGNDPIPEGKAIASVYGLIKKMPSAVVDQVKGVSQVVTKENCKGVSDLRPIPFVTIDPDSAKDFDDAVYAKKNDDGTYTLKVAIANVAKYVSKDSPLFNYAMELSNSSYLGETCYPMLPVELSNGICSLNENVDRLVMCTTCTIGQNGEIINYYIEPGVINSRHRLTYKEADYIHFGKNAAGDEQDHSRMIAKTIDVKDSLSDLYDVANILNKARSKRGSFEIDSKKLNFIFDESHTRVESFCKEHQEKFTSVIEETAVLTNEIWGNVAENLGLNFCYRNHNQLSDEKIPIISGKLKPFGIKLSTNPSGRTLQAILKFVKGKRIEEYVTSTILKALDNAYYSETNNGHAGLGIVLDSRRSNKQYMQNSSFKKEKLQNAKRDFFIKTDNKNGIFFDGDISHSAYGHTTSPIRRGADLINQLNFLNVIENEEQLFSKSEISDRCINLNFKERNSAEAEKEYDTMLSALWGIDHIGYPFHDCTIVDLGKFEADIVTADGFRLKLPYSKDGLNKHYAKIGQSIKVVSIDNVSTYPARIIGCKGYKKDINENSCENTM